MDQVYGKQLWERQKGSRGWGTQRWRGVTSVVRCHFCDNRGPSYILKYNCKYKYKYKYKYKHCNDWQNWNAKYHSGRVLLLWQSCLATYCTSRILKRKKTVQKKYRYKDEYKYSTMVLLLFSSTLSDKNWNTKHDRGEVSFLWQCLQAKRPSDRHFMRAQKYDPW